MIQVFESKLLPLEVFALGMEHFQLDLGVCQLAFEVLGESRGFLGDFELGVVDADLLFALECGSHDKTHRYWVPHPTNFRGLRRVIYSRKLKFLN